MSHFRTLTSCVCVLLFYGAQAIPAEAQAVALRPVWRSDPDVLLTRIEDLDVDSKGRVFIVEGRANPAVTVLGPDGHFAHHIGRAGEGPGEFREPLSLQVVANDTLMVYDRQGFRLSFFAPELQKPTRIIQLQPRIDGSAPFDVHAVPGGPLVVQFRMYYRAGADPAADFGRAQLFGLADQTSGENIGDPILQVPESGATIVARRDGLVGSTAVDFRPPHVVRIDGAGGLVYGAGNRLHVRFHDSRGAPTGEFSVPFTPTPFTSVDLAGELDRSSEFFQDAIRRAAPDRWPAYRDLALDDRGWVWLTMAGPRDRPTQVRIFGRDGTEVGQAVLPPRTRIHRIRDGHLYAVAVDDLDVPVVLKYAIRTP